MEDCSAWRGLKTYSESAGPLTPIEQRLSERYGVDPVVPAVGCSWCAQTGYYGRVPLLEVLAVTPACARPRAPHRWSGPPRADSS
ncbi:MAG: hypothetical protein ABJE47_24180, partial [bacterium]